MAVCPPDLDLGETMKRLLTMLCTAAMFAAGVLATSATVAVAGDDSDQRAAQSELLQIGQSGITGEIEFIDTGSALIVRGEAEGLNPAKHYISLLYDVGSVPTGRGACLPSRGPGSPGFLDEPKMFVAEWLPVGSSERTLRATKRGASYTPIGTFRTVSIREVVAVGLPQLRACGLVVGDD
jgi:hypothetical protein